jgi:hypothetical protein
VLASPARAEHDGLCAIYTEETMSRAIAVALLLVFSRDVVSPALFENAAATLPACCRRDGKHHCMKLTSDASDGGSLAKRVQQRCPYFPNSAPATGGNCSTPPPSRSLITSVFSHPTAKAQTDAHYRVSLIRGWQKRGPPFLA